MNELENDIQTIEDEIFGQIMNLDYAIQIHGEMIQERDFLIYCQTGKFPE